MFAENISVMHETTAYIKQTLQALYLPDEVRSLTRMLIEHVCGFPLHQQLLCKDTQLSRMQKSRIMASVQRLAESEPVQYVLGETLFHGWPFEVNTSTLIPRPETEELVALILQRVTAPGQRVLDIGTGSGCIAVTLAKCLPEAEVTAIDISGEALATAGRNARRNGVTVQFLQADILLSAPADGFPAFDLMVSNPPYVRESEKAAMRPNVLNHEPHQALFVPDDDPLLFYRRIADVAQEKLADDGALFFEINEACGAVTVEMLRGKGFRTVTLSHDLSGRDRFIEARKSIPE